MRCDNIAVNFKIPVRINKPDGNGNVYPEEVIIKACEKAEGLPITQFNDKGESVTIGIAKNVNYSDGYIYVDGVVWHGGTSESVKLLNKGTISSMEINSFGLCE